MIVWKDLFKPRYGLVIDVMQMPSPKVSECGSLLLSSDWKFFPACNSVPFKRPLNMGFGEFYTKLCKENNMVICGSKRTLKGMYGVGSTESHNLKNSRLLVK